jgi:hypothetical protein
MTNLIIPASLQNVEFPFQDISISADGYIRLTVESVKATVYVHLLSGLDEAGVKPEGEGAVSSEISGYSEWVSQTVPVITLGWDWFLDCGGGAQNLRRVGTPSSNVMVIDSDKNDIGYQATMELLCSVVDSMAWQLTVINFIRNRYTTCQC